MPLDRSYRYAWLVVGLVLVAAWFSPVVPAETRPNPPADRPAVAGIGFQPMPPTAGAGEPPTGGPAESPVEGPGDATTQPDEVRRHLGPVTVTIFLNCSYLEVRVEPTTFEYVLELVYRDAESGQRIPLLAGPFTGSVDDPFGRTGLVLLEVRVRVERVPPVGRLAPERCLPG